MIKLGPEELIITHISDDGSHVVGLIPDKKIAMGIYVANSKDIRGHKVRIASAMISKRLECAPKFYKSYRIHELSPYESNWTYVEAISDSVIYTETPPFTPIPMSTSDRKRLLLDAVTVNSIWSNDKDTWVVRDTCIERLMGKEKVRVWVTTTAGKRGQALYAESLINGYYLIADEH
jgi:hypothetical protein